MTAEILNWADDPALVDNLPHRHSFFEACLVGPYGRGRFVHEGEVHPLTPGTLFVPRIGAVHRIVNDEGRMALSWLSFAVPEGAGGALGRFAREGRIVGNDDGGLAAIVTAIRVAGPESRVALTRAFALAVAERLTDPLPEPAIGDPAFAIARRYLLDNLAMPVRTDHAARQAGVSERTLARIFARHGAGSPGRFLREARLAEAARLLRETELPVGTVGARVGWPDAPHFVRAFTARYGATPGRWRHVCPENTTDWLPSATDVPAI